MSKVVCLPNEMECSHWGTMWKKGLLNPVVIRTKQEKPKQIFCLLPGREQVVVVVVVAPKNLYEELFKKKGGIENESK